MLLTLDVLGWEPIRRLQYATITGGTGAADVLFPAVPKDVQRRIVAWSCVTDEIVGNTRHHRFVRTLGSGAAVTIQTELNQPGGIHSALRRPILLGPNEVIANSVALLPGTASLLLEIMYADTQVGEPIWID